MRPTHALILANGTPPSRRLFTALRKEADLFLCADGGANVAARWRVLPDLVVGDLDSISPAAVRALPPGIIHHVRDQNSTDLEKCLVWCRKHHLQRVTVLGATGGRLDHAVGNLSALMKFSASMEIRFVDDDGELIPIRRFSRLALRKGTTISLIPLTRCSGVTTAGLQWNLRDAVLAMGVRESTSNVVRSSPVTVRAGRGGLVAFIVRSR
jgi:thiamine pyrophosphokinase